MWVGHVCGAKEVIKASESGKYPRGSDCSIILGWMYYFDVLVRFSMRHWRTPLVAQVTPDLAFSSHGDSSCARQYALARASFTTMIPQISKHAHEVLRLLSEVCDTILNPWDPKYHSFEYQEYLDGLESRLVSLTFTTPPTPPPTTTSTSTCSTSPSPTSIASTAAAAAVEDFTPNLKLFRLSGLVYLARASRNFSGQSPKLDAWTDEAFAIFEDLESCRHEFPIFVIGCEARSDERRRVVLDLISRTQRDPLVRNVREVRILLQSAWVQDDLHGEGQLEYIRKVNVVMSAFGAVPIFV